MVSLILVCAAVLSCSEENVLIQDPGHDSGQIQESVTYLRFAGTPQAKTSFGPADGNTLPVLWGAADKLGLFLTRNGSNVSGAQNAYAMIDHDKGPGTGGGVFSAAVSGLAGSTYYDVQLYYPHAIRGGENGSVIHNRVFPTQRQLRPGSSAHVGPSGGFCVAKTHFTTPSNPDGHCAEMEFSMEHKVSYLWIDVTAAEGDYDGFILKRVRLSAPDGTYLSGHTAYNVSTDVMTLESSCRESSILLEIEEPQALGAAAQTLYMVVFPTAVKGLTLNLEYTLVNPENGTQIVLRHTRDMAASSTLFAPGKVYALSEQIPAKAGGDWLAADRVRMDKDWYTAKLQSIIERCGVLSLQVNYTSYVDTLSIQVVNEEMYAVGTRSTRIPPAGWSLDNIYQCCSISKVPFSYMVVKMDDLGIIDMDAPIVDFFPAFTDWYQTDEAKEYAKMVTPRMIITHVSGMDNSNETAGKDVKFRFKPGTDYYYSGTGMKMLQIAICGMTGKTIDELTHSYIFDKLDMPHTWYDWNNDADYYDRQCPSGLRFNEDGSDYWQRTQSKGAPSTASSLRTSADEFTKFMR